MVIFPILLLGLMASLSPVTIVVFILLLRTKRPQVNSAAFLVGWGLSLAVIVVGSYVFGSSQVSQRDGGGTAVSGVVLLLGLSPLVLAVREWRRRGVRQSQPRAPVSPGSRNTWEASPRGVRCWSASSSNRGRSPRQRPSS